MLYAKAENEKARFLARLDVPHRRREASILDEATDKGDESGGGQVRRGRLLL